MSDDDLLKQALFNLERTLDQVQQKLGASHVLNGGFDRLMEKVNKIEDTQDKILGEVNSLKSTVYDPDVGIFSRIKAAGESNADKVHILDKAITEIKIKQEEDIKDTVKFEQDIERIDDISDKVDDLVRWKGNLNKIIWAIAVPFATTFGKILYDFFAQHVNLH